jgi:hypothetical protein
VCSLLQAEKASGVFGKAQCLSKHELTGGTLLGFVEMKCQYIIYHYPDKTILYIYSMYDLNGATSYQSNYSHIHKIVMQMVHVHKNHKACFVHWHVYPPRLPQLLDSRMHAHELQCLGPSIL